MQLERPRPGPVTDLDPGLRPYKGDFCFGSVRPDRLPLGKGLSERRLGYHDRSSAQL